MLALRPETALLLAAVAATGQQPAATLGTVSTEGVTLTGALQTGGALAVLGNNSSVTAGQMAATVQLARGGRIEVCTGTTLHLATEVEPHTRQRAADAGLLLSLDHGAVQAQYSPGAFADELLTPDLRLMISAPGTADFSMRVNTSGDTCFDNAGASAPYVLASSLRDGGVYRIQPGQRVLFVGGSLSRVVDNEHEPCGCPPGPQPGAGAENQFPLAVSEGLQTPPVLTQPVVPEGDAHVQATATLSSSTPPAPPPRRSFFESLAHAVRRLFGGS